MVATILDRGRECLDGALRAVHAGAVGAGLDQLLADLCDLRGRSAPDEWRDAARTLAEGHALVDLLRKAPLTGRAFREGARPRSPRRTISLDDVLGERSAGVPVSTELAPLERWERSLPGVRALAARHAAVARAVDDVARRREGARVLSVACGDLRELQQSDAIAEGRVRHFYAFDGDERNLESPSDPNQGACLRAVRGTLEDLLLRKWVFVDCDLIYSVGLFDLLDDDLASLVLRAMSAALAPGGRILVANFGPDLADAAYFDTVIGLELEYRDEARLVRLADGVPDRLRGRVTTYPSADVNWLEIER